MLRGCGQRLLPCLLLFPCLLLLALSVPILLQGHPDGLGGGAIVGADFKVGQFESVIGLEGNDCRFVVLHDDGGDALCDNAYLACSADGEVDDASPDVGSPVGDAHDDALVAFGVGNFEQCAEGVGLVGAGERVGMQAFAVGRALSRKIPGVEGGISLLGLGIYLRGKRKEERGKRKEEREMLIGK